MSQDLAQRLSKVGLLVGFLALFVAAVVAHDAPATGYELSLYRATPTTVWAGLAVAAAVGVAVALAGPARGYLPELGATLTAGAVLTVVALPAVRGYYFYGAGDSLSHLGWARELATGALEPVNLLYPGVHAVTVFGSRVLGVPLTLSNLYVVLVAFPLVSVVFTGLCVGLLAGTRRGVAVGVLAAALFTPVNGIAVHLVAHPASQAILFLPFVLYLALRYCALGAFGAGSTGRITPLGVLLAVVASAVVLVHPQQALNVVVLFGAIAGVQALVRRSGWNHPIASHRPMYAQTGLAAAAFLLWAPRFERVKGAFLATLLSVLGQGPTTGEVVSAKSVSIAAVGGDIATLFLKLFFPSVVFSVLAAALMAALVLGVRDQDVTSPDSLSLYLTVALVPLFCVFLLLVASSTGDMYFRYQGFIMVPVTVLGAVALARLVADRALVSHRGATDGGDSPSGGRRPRDAHSPEDTRRADDGRPALRVVAVVLFLVLLPLGALAVHPSPYVLQPSQHVPESEADGYRAAFAHRDPDLQFTGLRGGPQRFVDAVYGTQRARTSLNFPGYEDGVGEAVFRRGNYTDAYNHDRYLVVSTSAYEKEVRLYGGFRFPRSGFERLESTRGVSRVRASDGLRVYYVEGEEE